MLPYIDPQTFKEQTNNNDKNFPQSHYKANKKSDVYSVGVLLWEISSGKKPFKSHQQAELMLEILNGKREVPIPDTPVYYINIYTSKLL
jgi:serine/threonine protein kinase